MSKKKRSPESKNYFLREFPSWKYRELDIPDDFKRFAHAIIIPKFDWKGYKITEKQDLAIHIAHNLILTGLAGASVSDSRDRNEKGITLRLSIWDAFIAKKFAYCCVGSEQSGMQTRYRATAKLLNLRRLWELKLLLDLNLRRFTDSENPSKLSLIYLHTGRVDPVSGKPLDLEDQCQPISLQDYIKDRAQKGADGTPDPRAVENGMNHYQGIEDVIERVNRTNLSFSWKAFATDPETGRKYAFQPNPCLRQIHVGEMGRGCRLYSWSQISGQNLTKAQRREMLIGGKRTTELDFSGYQTRMLYHRRGLNPKGDVYRPEMIFPTLYSFRNVSKRKKDVSREFVKRATNICWNVTSRGAAHSSAGLLLAEHPERETLREIIYEIEETSPGEIIDRIEAAHPQLKNHRLPDPFFTGTGMDLMTTDGRIMLMLLSEFVVQRGKPALAIHDSVVVRTSDADLAHKLMVSTYKKFLHFSPVISKVN